MTIAATESRTAGGQSVRIPAVPLWVWWLLAVAAATGLALLSKGTGRTFEFIDSDDALRFVHVRELLAGAPWFEVQTGLLVDRAHLSLSLDLGGVGTPSGEGALPFAGRFGVSLQGAFPVGTR